MLKTLQRFFLPSLFIFLSGCSVSTQVTNSPRSTVEQQLLVRSLERAVDRLDIQRLKGKTVFVDLYGLTPDKDFAKEFVAARLQAKQVRVAAEAKKAQLRLKIFAPVLGADQGQSFFGIPSVPVPLLGLSTPEIALYKAVRHRGRAEVEIYTLNNKTGELVGRIPPGAGDARHDQYTVLVFANFTRSDLEKSEAGSDQTG